MAAKSKAPTESELKYGLEKIEYARLRAHFRRKRTTTSTLTNVYFDDPRTLLLRMGKCGLRIRFAKGKAPVLTLKYPPATGTKRRGPEAFRVRHEHEAKLPARQASLAATGRTSIVALHAEPIRVLRTRFSPDALQAVAPLGKMKMTRTRIPWQNGLTLELDRFEVEGQRFYELEIETEKPRLAERLLRELFDGLHIPVRPVLISKLGRFFQVTEAARKKATAAATR